LDFGFQGGKQKLSFSHHLYATKTPEYAALVKKIAEAFDAELRAGKHQEHFGRIVSEVKKIRSVH